MSILQKVITKDTSKEVVGLTVSRAAARDGSIKRQKMNNDKTVVRPGDQEPISSADYGNVAPSSDQSSNSVADGRLVGSKVWRNMSYMMATDESLLKEINEGRDVIETKTGSTFPAKANGRLSHYVSGINLIY